MRMGELPDAGFVSTLVVLLDDRESVRHAALESLPKVVGRDVSQDGEPPLSPAGTSDLSGAATRPAAFLSPTPSSDEQVRRWKQWYRREQQRSTAAPNGMPPQMRTDERIVCH